MMEVGGDVLSRTGEHAQGTAARLRLLAGRPQQLRPADTSCRPALPPRLPCLSCRPSHSTRRCRHLCPLLDPQ
jgi:hypothetical protein